MCSISRICTLVCVLMLGAAGAGFGWRDHRLALPQEQTGDRVAITLVLVSNGAPPTVLRRRAEPANVVLLDSASADVQQLSDAIFGLLIAESNDPQGRGRADHTATRITISQRRPVYPWAAETLRQLRTSPPQPVPGVGRHRTLRIQVPRMVRSPT